MKQLNKWAETEKLRESSDACLRSLAKIIKIDVWTGHRRQSRAIPTKQTGFRWMKLTFLKYNAHSGGREVSRGILNTVADRLTSSPTLYAPKRH